MMASLLSDSLLTTTDNDGRTVVICVVRRRDSHRRPDCWTKTTDDNVDGRAIVVGQAVGRHGLRRPTARLSSSDGQTLIVGQAVGRRRTTMSTAKPSSSAELSDDDDGQRGRPDHHRRCHPTAGLSSSVSSDGQTRQSSLNNVVRVVRRCPWWDDDEG